ncbi:hypothetical protein AVEN_66859-1, partial [Araneus ventricosus]
EMPEDRCLISSVCRYSHKKKSSAVISAIPSDYWSSTTKSIVRETLCLVIHAQDASSEVKHRPAEIKLPFTTGPLHDF